MDGKSKYTKILITILIIFIMIIVFCSFILSDVKYVITFETIICLVLMLILILADSFDNLSIPKILSLSKNVKEVKKENNDLRETNIKLLEQVISIKNSNSQNIYFPNSFSTVGSSDINDINKIEENETTTEQMSNSENHTSQKRISSERYKYRRGFELYLLEKALNADVNNSEVQYDVKVRNNKPIEDNIMKNEARFDALKSNGQTNVFYEVKTTPFLLDYAYQLHYMLRMIELYQEASKCSSRLVLVLPLMDKELERLLFNRSDNRFSLLKERISNRFDPAIKSGLLEIVQIYITKEELDEYINNKEEK